jgi:PST family polysaccharide transporter
LALTVWIQITLSSSGAIYQAMDKSRWLFINGLISTFIIVSAIVAGVVLGTIMYVALFLSVAFLINYVVSFNLLIHNALSTNFSEIARCMIKPFIITIFYTILAIGLNKIIGSNQIYYNFLFQSLFFVTFIIFSSFITGEAASIRRILKRNKAI